MSTPKRIQLRRTKGWSKPQGAVVVARPTKWGNPYSVLDSKADEIMLHEDGRSWWLPESGARQSAVDCHRADLLDGSLVLGPDDIELLRGHDLACWCPLDQPCHADVLLEVANS